MANSNRHPAVKPRRKLQRSQVVVLIGILGLLTLLWQGPRTSNYLGTENPTPPLVMQAGNPYVRALMRTISASEAHDPSPYNLLYGGGRSETLRHHPDQCITILAGPNQGNCTTAAGRYQFITTTWLDKAQQYHPNPSEFWLWESFSFEPKYQDAVVYAWLMDSQAWGGEEIPVLLQEGQLDQVLHLLSGTWTSLGYGIEDNAMTSSLGHIYQKMLAEELAQTQAAAP